MQAGAPIAHVPANTVNATPAADSVFNFLRGEGDEQHTLNVMQSVVAFQSCTFRALSAFQNAPRSWTEFGWPSLLGSLHCEGLNTTVALENCTFEDTRQAWPIILRTGSTLFSDNPEHLVRATLIL